MSLNEAVNMALKKLIEDTLYGRKLEGDRCFFVNAAGLELEEQNESALVLIEEILAEQVAPVSHNCTNHNELLEYFDGLLYLFMSYYIISKRTNSKKILTLLSSLSGPLLICAFIALDTTFCDRARHKPSIGKIPKDVLDYIDKLKETLNEHDKETANFVIKYF